MDDWISCNLHSSYSVSGTLPSLIRTHRVRCSTCHLSSILTWTGPDYLPAYLGTGRYSRVVNLCWLDEYYTIHHIIGCGIADHCIQLASCLKRILPAHVIPLVSQTHIPIKPMYQSDPDTKRPISPKDQYTNIPIYQNTKRPIHYKTHSIPDEPYTNQIPIPKPKYSTHSSTTSGMILEKDLAA